MEDLPEARHMDSRDNRDRYRALFDGVPVGLFRTTPEGEIAPTGRKIEFRLAFFAKMNAEGLIQEDRTYYDTASMMGQLGLS